MSPEVSSPEMSPSEIFDPAKFPPEPPADFADHIAKCKIRVPGNLPRPTSPQLALRATNTYTCLHKSPCPRKTCVIHGNPSNAELSARIPHKVGGYQPENPRKLCSLDGCGLHSSYRPIYSVYPRSIEAIRREEDTGTVPGSVGLGLKPGCLVDQEKEACASRNEAPAAPSHAPSEYSDASEQSDVSEQLDLVKNDDPRFIKPDGSYVLTKVGRCGDPGPTVNRDYISKIFKSEQERAQIFQAYHRGTKIRYDETPPLMLTYGIQYAPEPGSNKRAASRKVLITGLETRTPLADIMARVRGGKILKVTSATSPRPMGHTVIVEFVHPEDAKKYVTFIAGKVEDLFRPNVKVTLLKSHSYPISMEIQNDLNHKFTRLVVYLDFSKHSCQDFLIDFEARFTKPQDLLEDIWTDNEGRLWILFKTVFQAGRFYKQTIRELEHENPGSFDVSLWRFAPDPCDAPVEQLDDFNGPDVFVNMARGSNPSMLDAHLKGRVEEWDWCLEDAAGKNEEEEDEESPELGRASPAAPEEEEATAPLNSSSPEKSSDSGDYPNEYSELSNEERFREIPGLGAGMWMRPWFLETLRKMEEADDGEYPEVDDFLRHRSQSRHVSRRHRRDSSLTHFEKPKDEPGVLEKFCEEQVKLRRERTDSTTPENSFLVSSLDHTDQSTTSTKNGLEYETKMEDETLELDSGGGVKRLIIRDLRKWQNEQKLRKLQEAQRLSRIDTPVPEDETNVVPWKRVNSYANDKEERENYDEVLATYSAPQLWDGRKKYPLTVEGEIERLNDEERARKRKELGLEEEAVW